MTTQPQAGRVKEVTAQKCYDMGVAAYGRQADQQTAAYNPLGGTGTEACANCLFFISPNGCTVVEDYPAPISPTGLSKFWTAIPTMGQSEPLRVVIVTDAEAEVEMEGMKAVWTAAAFNDLPDSSFAVISSGGEKDEDGKTTPRSLRHLPYKDAGGKVDLPHLRNALSRLPQTDLTAAERATAQRKLDAAAREAGIETDRGESGKGLLDRIVAAVKGAFLSSPSAAGTESAQHSPSPDAAVGAGVTSPMFMPGEGGAFRVYKETTGAGDGAWRWIALVTNQYRDHDNKANGPEIIEAAAHREYVAYLDKSGDYPEAWLWHTPGTRWGRADWADYADGFLVMSGTVDKGMEDVALALAKDDGLGVSHGFFQRYADAEKGIIGWYRTFEVSPLPREAAANPWTGLAVIQKEAAMAISAGKRAFLESKLGKDRVAALDGDVTALAKALQEAGVEFKDLITADAPDAPEAGQGLSLSAKDIADAVSVALAPTTAAVTAMAETVLATKASADATAGALPGIMDRLKALERSDDAKIAAAFTPRVSVPAAAGGYRATGDKATEIGAGDDLADKKPEIPASQAAWLEKALAF